MFKNWLIVMCINMACTLIFDQVNANFIIMWCFAQQFDISLIIPWHPMQYNYVITCVILSAWGSEANMFLINFSLSKKNSPIRNRDPKGFSLELKICTNILAIVADDHHHVTCRLQRSLSPFTIGAAAHSVVEDDHSATHTSSYDTQIRNFNRK